MAETKTQSRKRAEFIKRMLDRIDVRVTFEFDLLFLKRAGVVGPFGTIIDSLQLMTLGLEGNR